MKSLLETLGGSKISKIVQIHDYVQIYFENKSILTIFSEIFPEKNNLSMFEGKRVVSVIDEEDKAIINLENGQYISIGLRDQDYDGPEAMVLHREGENIVVWNRAL